MNCFKNENMKNYITELLMERITASEDAIYGIPSAAKSIAIHSHLFTEWCIENVYFIDPNYMLLDDNKAIGTLSEVYNYWLTIKP